MAQYHTAIFGVTTTKGRVRLTKKYGILFLLDPEEVLRRKLKGKTVYPKSSNVKNKVIIQVLRTNLKNSQVEAYNALAILVQNIVAKTDTITGVFTTHNPLTKHYE